jgi:tetratricopeptide (TPR) repeat protein
MRTITAVLLHLAIAGSLLAVPPRITFERLIPAAHDLGQAEEVAIVNAIGDDSRIETFLDRLIFLTNRSRTLRMRDLRFGAGPADAHLDIRNFTCKSTEREAEASTRDPDGKRVKRKAFAAEAVCTARIAILSHTLKPLSSFEVKAEGSSPRVVEVTDEERAQALDDAAHRAAAIAAERITPRYVQESIALEETAPALEEGLTLLDGERFTEVRTLWEAAAKKHPRSAPLQFNLAAVCEALGDRKAAEKHYQAAKELAPKEARYSSELRLFMLRAPARK